MEFKDPILQEKFDKQHYLVADFLDTAELNDLWNAYHSFDIKKVADFQVSNYEKNPALNRKIDAAIKNVITERIASFIKDYRLLTAYFYIKYPGKSSSFYIHKDWNVVDETQHTSMHIWIPLMDTTTENGNLFICPYNSGKKDTYRGSPGFEFPKQGILTQLMNKFYKKDIYTKKGQAIFFKHHVIHGSRPNLSNEDRIVAGISLIPADAKMLHYHQNKFGTIEKHYVKDDFYIDFDLNTITQNNGVIIKD